MSEERLRSSVSACWVLAAIVLAACGRTTDEPSFGSETNWLRQCSSDSECSDGECVCGVCSAGCASDDDCPAGLVCERESSPLYLATCGVSELRGLCSPMCERSSDCAGSLECIDGVCAPAPRSGSADGGFEVAREGLQEPFGVPRDLFIDAHLALSPECIPDLERPIGSGVGVFDLGHDHPTGNCMQPYRLNLRVGNLLNERVLVTKVDVVLQALDGSALVLSQPPLKNPISLSVTGSVPAGSTEDPGLAGIVAEVIPIGYASSLRSFIGGQMGVRAQLSGETIGGDTVRSNVFEYRLEICEGCLSRCRSTLEGSPITEDELTAGMCVDNAGADGRVCLDPAC